MTARKVLSFIKKPQKVSFQSQEQINANNRQKREETLKKINNRTNK